MSNPYMHCNPIPNFDAETQIHYGVIPSNDLNPDAFSDIESNGTDLGYEQAVEQIKDELKAAINGVLKDYVSGKYVPDRVDEAVDELWDGVSDLYDYESGGDATRYRYESDGYILETDSQGDIFVIKSPYYTRAAMCSPCAPNAGYLRDSGSLKTYALGFDWFDKDSPAPYDRIFGVGTDLEIIRPEEQGGKDEE